MNGRFTAVFDRVRVGALRHEHDRSLPHDEVRRLAAAGFGAVRLPVAEGGGGLTLTQFFGLLVELGAADSNQPQIWRNHIAFVEDRLQPQPAGANAHWRRVVAGGAVVGGAWSERGNTSLADFGTELRPGAGRPVLSGVKYYSTGSNVADWISVAARREGDPGGVIAVVDARAPGVRIEDDWTGFGQTTTGSGTTRFDGVEVDDVGVFAFTDRAPYQEALYQLVHVATLAGIARAAHRDAVERVQARTRSYPHGLHEQARHDAQVQAVVGRVGALAASVAAGVERAARALDHAADAALGGAPDDEVTARSHEAAVAVYEAQLTATDDTLAATTLLFDALSSSALDTSLALDRHWRNARTITSHNPRVYKERLLGDWYLNATPPVVYGGSGEADNKPGTTPQGEREDAA